MRASGSWLGRSRRVVMAWVVCAFVLACNPTLVLAQTQLSAEAGEVRALLHVDATVALAGTVGGGLYRSVDAGATWAPLAALPARTVNGLASADSSTVYAATNDGLYKSPDKGVSWSRLTRDESRSVAVNAQVVLLGVPGIGLLRSADGGTTFADASAGLNSADVWALSFDPTDASKVYAALFNPIYATGSETALGGVFFSSDGGQTWSNISSGLLTYYVTSVVVDNTGQVYAGTADPWQRTVGSVQRYTGSSWTNPTTESDGLLFDVYCLARDAFRPADLLACSGGMGPYRGKSGSPRVWERQMDGSFATDGQVLSRIYSLAAHPSNGRLFAGVSGIGLYRSQPVTGGATNGSLYSTWTSVSGIKADRVRSLTGDGGTTLWMGLASGGAWRSTDNGSSWQRFNAGWPSGTGVPSVPLLRSVEQLAFDGANVFAAVLDNGLWRSSGGSSWTAVTNAPTSWFPTGLLAPSAGTVFASEFYVLGSSGGMSGVLKFTNAGGTAVRTNPVLISGSSGPCTTALPCGWNFHGSGMGRLIQGSTAQRIFALMLDGNGPGSAANAVGYRSTDGGTSWQPMTASHTGFMRMGFYALADQGTTVLGSSLKGLFRSADGGASFSRITPTGLPDHNLTGLAYASGGWFGTTADGRLWCSTDNGSNWQQRSSGTTSHVNDLRSIGGNLYILTDGAGVIRTSLSCP